MHVLREKASILSFTFLALSLVAACAGPSMRVPVTRPAEIYLKEPRKVLITDFRGNGGQAIAAALTRQLVESGKFEVLDRTVLAQKLMASNPNLQPTASQAVTSAFLDRLYRPGKNRLLGRGGMEIILRDAAPGLVGPDKQTIMTEMAKLVGGGYLISGEVTDFSYTKQDSRGPLNKDSKGRMHPTFQKEATASVSADVQIVNISTGAIVASKTIAKKRSRPRRPRT